MTLDAIIAALLMIITVVGAIFGTMKFMLKDVFTAIHVMDGHVKEIKQENIEMEKRWIETNKRMDGVYHILLKRIKEE